MPATCMSCGAEWGQPHGPTCEFTYHRPALRVLAAAALLALVTLAATR